MTPWNDPKIAWRQPQKKWYNLPLAALRLSLLILITLIGFLFVVLAQIIQKLIGRYHLELIIQKIWAKLFLRIIGMRLDVRGKCAGFGGAVVANHTSWLDVMVISASSGGYFVAKSEIANWPVAGVIAKLLRTEFLIRDRKYAKQQVDRLRQRYAEGDHLIFFPEGTTTDGLEVIAFKSSLFESLADEVKRPLLQPMTIFYQAPIGASANFFGLYGDMSAGVHAWGVLQIWRHKPVLVHFDAPIDQPRERRALTKKAEEVIRSRHSQLMEEAGIATH